MATAKKYNFEGSTPVEDVNGDFQGVENILLNGNKQIAIVVTCNICGNIFNSVKEYIFDTTLNKYIEFNSGLFPSQAMIADRSTYVNSTTGTIVPSLEALDENGNIKVGYTTQFDFFKNSAVGQAVYGWIAQGLLSRF